MHTPMCPEDVLGDAVEPRSGIRASPVVPLAGPERLQPDVADEVIGDLRTRAADDIGVNGPPMPVEDLDEELRIFSLALAVNSPALRPNSFWGARQSRHVARALAGVTHPRPHRIARRSVGSSLPSPLGPSLPTRRSLRRDREARLPKSRRSTTLGAIGRPATREGRPTAVPSEVARAA